MSFFQLTKINTVDANTKWITAKVSEKGEESKATPATVTTTRQVRLGIDIEHGSELDISTLDIIRSY